MIFKTPSCSLLLLLSYLLAFRAPLVASSSETSTPTLPRSHVSRRRRESYPPWNPSPLIRDDGFLQKKYSRIPGEWEKEARLRTYTCDVPVSVRQVPGDGSCLFHSCSVALGYAVNNTHWDLKERLDELYDFSRELRRQAVECLQDQKRKLFLQGRELLRAGDLVTAAAQQYGLTGEEYCQAMQSDATWAGGPEIVALCNILQRPIHVYELVSGGGPKREEFRFRRMACFGSPRFDNRQPIHILSADSRFPDVEPGQQLPAGNHFLALFPVEKLRRRRIRGGAGSDDDVDDSELNFLRRLWERLRSVSLL